MTEVVYIDGTVVVENGVFYSKNLVVLAGDEYKQGAKVITPLNSLLTITADYGSIFTNYYLRGGVACRGLDDGNALSFSIEHESTCNSYKDNIRLLANFMDEMEIPEAFKNIYYQQQYVSAFGALEYFLFYTFMGRVCSDYDIYTKVLSSRLSCLEYGREIRNILRGEHNIKQERVFIEQTKEVVYHNTKQVSDLFSTAFGISVDLGVLESNIITRNDIVHRFGHTKKGYEILVIKDDVLSLIDKINIIVEKIMRDLDAFDNM